MKEETLFAVALEKETPAERAAFLDEACAGDAALRQRLEALLQSHDHAEFLKTPAVKRAAEEVGGAPTTGTAAGPTDSDDPDSSLDFLTPSDKTGSLGRLGHYEVLEVIGRGGMGVVLRVFDQQLQRVAAIKVMAPTLPANGAARQRFVREARAAAAVRDEHVVGIYAVEEACETPYLVMEYIAGVSLQERLDRGGPLEVKEVLRIGLQTAAGLAAAHAQGLIHRDVKPANLLLENGVERVKITDFGLARAAADASLTQAGQVAGTPQYMAPEQARGEGLDHRADLFSLGSVLYALCTGRPPFRGENTLAVLKRVCEETPPPIRDINPDVPERLVEIIARLQAKEPAGRFQSALEVAAVLGRELAAMQRGGVERPQPPRPPPPRRSRRHWAAAAAALLLLAAGFVLTETIGMTHVIVTALRGFTPSHPSVAKRDHGRNEVAPAEPPAQADPLKPFVILGGKGVQVGKYGTLAEAVRTASDGDTIEVRGNGPFVTKPIEATGRALTIRAGAGFRPTIQLSLEGLQSEAPLLRTDSRLVLEGLEFQRVSKRIQGEPVAICLDGGAPMHIANCRFPMQEAHTCLGGGNCEFRNCEFLGAPAVTYFFKPEGQLVMDNCLQCGPVNTWAAISIHNEADPKNVTVQLTRNTMVTDCPLLCGLARVPKVLDKNQPAKRVQVEASANVFDGRWGFFTLSQTNLPDKATTLAEPAEVEALAARLFAWRGQRNLYPAGVHLFCGDAGPNKPLQPTRDFTSLATWKEFWGTTEAGSLQGRARFQGGDLRAKVASTPELVTPEDFRLRPDSPGYRAGKDGKDLGADIDLVGPGPAYERWKKTPEYQRWCKDTGQLRALAEPRPERGAFVILGGKGVQVGKYDTLAEAVRTAGDGDTIEIRGNGPFVSEPVKIGNHALTIRAAAGCRPVIQGSREPTATVAALFESDSPLVLEGLELRWINDKAVKPGPTLVVSHGSSVHVANCRFHSEQITYAVHASSPICVIQNCEFYTGPVGSALGTHQGAGGRRVMENCVQVGMMAVQYGHELFREPGDGSIRLIHNTFVNSVGAVYVRVQKPISWPPGSLAAKPIRVDVASNVFDCSPRGALMFVQSRSSLQGKPFAHADAAALLRRLIDWRGRGNLYTAGSSSVTWTADDKDYPGEPTNLGQWQQFWGNTDADAAEGKVRFRGGNLLKRLAAAPDKITPEDFRLRPDSAGYRAGEDGKDLGADVDLVGPGKAYERWKKTPEYQRWCKDTGQLRALAESMPERGAFVILGGKGVQVGKYDTLAEAVRTASDGDAIEIRGNGPFVSQPVTIIRTGLVIRAGKGFRPVIRLSLEGRESEAALLRSYSQLVLEGLEFQRVGQKRLPDADGPRALGIDVGGSAYIANCRFVMRDTLHVRAGNGPVCELRNCEFVGGYGGGPPDNHYGVQYVLPTKGGLALDNCVQVGSFVNLNYYDADPEKVTVRLTRNTLLAGEPFRVSRCRLPKVPAAGRADRGVKVVASGNVFDGRSGMFCLTQGPRLDHLPGFKPAAEPAAVETLLRHCLAWRGQHNLYPTGVPLLGYDDGARDLPPTRDFTGLAAWKEFWATTEAGSLQGRPKYRGGDLRSRAAAAPESVTPDDFRLRPDSPGYRAGENGKDLGADLDLVGPGPAYERWKKTAEYQQWLKYIGQANK